MIFEADNTARKLCDAMVAEHAKRVILIRGSWHGCNVDAVWVEQQNKDISSRGQQQSWYISGVILRNTGQDVYVIYGGNNKRWCGIKLTAHAGTGSPRPCRYL